MTGRFSLGDELDGKLREGILDDSFVLLTESSRRNGISKRVSVRRIALGDRTAFQIETREAGAAPIVKNRGLDEMPDWIGGFLANGCVRDIHLSSTSGDLHIRVTRKGKVHVSRSAGGRGNALKDARHDREKHGPLDDFDSSAFLRIAGIAADDGGIKASMRGKYKQVNEFLRAAAATLKEKPDAPLRIVDCGCGKAYLSLALHLWLERAMGFANVRTVGVDRREDVVAAAREAAARLDIADRAKFVASDIESFDPGGADLVVSLHACDTATDEALAKAVEWKAKYVLSAPCCQHELQKSLGGNAPFAALLRQSILRERMCDLLTDAFRAQIMRILGYRTQVAEFVDPGATARNIMLRCVWGVKPGQAAAVGEYLDLRDFWKVRPWLEQRLETRLAPLLERYA